jgi:hypothetical protein
MNPKLARLLTHIYPRSWRERYQREFAEFLETGRGDLRTVANVAWSGLRERIFPLRELTSTDHTAWERFHSACVRRGPSSVLPRCLFLLVVTSRLV